MALTLPPEKEKSELTKDFFEDFMTYDRENGQLSWLPRGPELFDSDWRMNVWNARYANKVVGSILRYYRSKDIARVQFTLALETFSVHRVIALFEGLLDVYGSGWHIDHIDGDPTNNHVSNLRIATVQTNHRNKKLKKIGTNSPVTGVYFHKPNGTWHATIGTGRGGKGKSLGYFKDKFEAICARKSAEVYYGYTDRHGYNRKE